MSLVFYDTETTGTETYFDQILQFAAIRTDHELNELERFEIRCQLMPHVVPAPGAMRVTGVKASQLIDPNIPTHYEMMRTIREKLLSWSPAVFIGWNTIEFDEDLVRQALYKTLHPPYLTNTDGNTRSDALRIAQACSLVAPDALVFPINEKGKKSFKLDRLAPANGFNHANAHDALADVEATIFICRKIMDAAPEIWSSFMRFSTKSAVADFVGEEDIYGFCEFYYGKPYAWMVTTLGQNPQINSEWYVYDLSVSPESLMHLSGTALAKRLEQSPKPIRKLKSNAAPIIFSVDDGMPISGCAGLSLEELERRAELIKSNDQFRKTLITAYEQLKEEYPVSIHVEKQIYNGFFERSDERLLEKFHAVDWAERYAIIEKLQDLRLKAMGLRLIYLERPDLLDAVTKQQQEEQAARRLLGLEPEAAGLTLPEALKQLDEMLAAATEAEMSLLIEHKAYLQQKHAQAQQTLTKKLSG